MLAELTVRNFALIEEIQLTFGPGFNVLTGETGAGKSIIVGAINLILGARASSEMIRAGSDEAEVQALFSLENPDAFQRRFNDLGLEPADEVIIRRVLHRSGRNRIYINGSLMTLSQLSTIGGDLVAVSGQHEHQQLLEPDRRLFFLDSFGGLLAERSAMAEAHADLARLSSEEARLQRDIGEAREKAELLEFQAREIEAAGLQPGEDEQLGRERNLLRNAEKIHARVASAYDRLYGETGAVIEILDMVKNDLEQAADLDDRLVQTRDQVAEAFHQLDDAAGVLRGHRNGILFDPARLEEIEDRLAVIQRLKRKYGPTIEEVLVHGDRAAGLLDGLADMKSRLEKFSAEVAAARGTARDTARDLGEKRRRAAVRMAEAMTRELRSLGMPHLEFDLAFLQESEPGEPGPTGWEVIEYMMSPNLGEELMPLSRIASGGELSRTMLGLKSLLAGREKIQTIVFDEVDAGIGGAVAEVVGRKLKNLSGYHQLLCITHLPQIAAFSLGHHHVYKEVKRDRTLTGIRPLSEPEKREEIARMIGGVDLTAGTLAAAKEMIERSREGGQSR